MGVYLEPSDLTPFATVDAVKAAAMIEDAEAMAGMVAPCLSDINVTVPDAHRAAVKAILRGAILRWHEAGTGAVQSQAAGPLSMTLDTRQQRRGMFYPSEINQLQAVCSSISGANGRQAFSIDLTPAGVWTHQPWCALAFGATYCSCGADINDGVPLYEGGTLS